MNGKNLNYCKWRAHMEKTQSHYKCDTNKN